MMIRSPVPDCVSKTAVIGWIIAKPVHGMAELKSGLKSPPVKIANSAGEDYFFGAQRGGWLAIAESIPLLPSLDERHLWKIEPKAVR